MIESQEVSGRKRRSREEIKRLMMEFESSGLRQSEFCRKHGLALSTWSASSKRRFPVLLFDKLNGSLSIDQDRLKFAEYKNRVLEERLRLLRIEKYGPGSEKLFDAHWSSWNWSRGSAELK
jgi:hypothetical protein